MAQHDLTPEFDTMVDLTQCPNQIFWLDGPNSMKMHGRGSTGFDPVAQQLLCFTCIMT